MLQLQVIDGSLTVAASASKSLGALAQRSPRHAIESPPN